MHELSLATGVVKTAIAHGERAGFDSITELSVVVGDLQQIDVEAFREMLKEQALSNALTRAARIVIEPEKPVLKCNNCGKEWVPALDSLSEHDSEAIHFLPESAKAYMECPECASKDVSIISGRGVYIKHIKGVKND